MGRIQMGFVVVMLFFGGSNFLIREKLSSVSGVRRNILGRTDIFVAADHVIIFVIPWCIWFVKIAFFICVFIRIWAFGLTISELEIVFIESRVGPNTLFLGAASTVDTLHALFFWIVIIVFLISELLSLCLTDERESKDIAIGVKKGKRGIFFVIEEFNLKYLSVQIDCPAKLIRLFFLERRLH